MTQDNSPTTVLNIGGSLTLGGAAGNLTAQLSFDLSPSSNASDVINVGGALTGKSGGAVINIGTTPLNSGTYTLINYGSESGLTVGTNLTVGTHPLELDTFNLSLGTAALTLSVVGNPIPNVAYWTGNQGGSYDWGDYSGSTTNWSTDPAGAMDTGQLVGPNTDVVFAASTASSASLTTNLEKAYTINSLTVLGSGATAGTAPVVGGINALVLNGLPSASGGMGYTSEGIVLASGAAGLTISTSGGVVVANNQSWTNNSGNLLSVSSAVTGNSGSGSTTTLTFDGVGSGGALLSGSIGDGSAGGNLALVINTSGAAATLSNTNTFSGGTTVLAGTLNVSPAGSLLSGSTLSVGAAGTANLAYLSPNLGAVSNAGALNFANTAGTVTLGSLSGAGNTNFAANAVVGGTFSQGSAAVALNAVLAAVSGGTLSVNGASSIATVSGGTLNLNGATSSITTLSGGQINLGSTALTVNNGNFAGTIAGSGSLVKGGGSGDVLTLPGPNTYSGGTELNAGTLVLGSTGAIGTGTLTITGGSLDSAVAGLVNANNNPQNWNGNFTFLGSNSLNLGNGAVTLGANPTVTVSANTLTVAGAISGSGYGLTKAGAGTLTLSGSNTYSGSTTVSGGALNLSNQYALQNSTLTSGGAGLVFDQSVSGNFTLGGLSGSAGLALQDNGSNAVALSVGNNNQNTTYSGVVSSIGGLIKIGSGMLTLSGSNTYTGATIINQGTLQLNLPRIVPLPRIGHFHRKLRQLADRERHQIPFRQRQQYLRQQRLLDVRLRREQPPRRKRDWCRASCREHQSFHIFQYKIPGCRVAALVPHYRQQHPDLPCRRLWLRGDQQPPQPDWQQHGFRRGRRLWGIEQHRAEPAQLDDDHSRERPATGAVRRCRQHEQVPRGNQRRSDRRVGNLDGPRVLLLRSDRPEGRRRDPHLRHGRNKQRSRNRRADIRPVLAQPKCFAGQHARTDRLRGDPRSQRRQLDGRFIGRRRWGRRQPHQQRSRQPQPS